MRSSWSPQQRARARAAAASVVVGLITAALPMIVGGVPVRAQLLLALAGIGALVAAVTGWMSGFTLAALTLGSEYALRLANRRGLDGWAVVEAGMLFAMVELGMRSLDARSIARPEPELRRAATLRLVVMLAAAVLSATVVIALGSRQLPAPTAGLALGLAAATTLLGAADLLRRRVTGAVSPHPRPRSPRREP